MAGSNITEKAEKILRYWHTMEFLTQDSYDPRWDVRKKVKEVKRACNAGKNCEKMLWDYVELQDAAAPRHIAGKEARSCGMGVWGNITVYIGKIKREICIEQIASLLAEEKENRCEKVYDEIPWMSLQVAPDGTYIEHSLSLSTVIWAMSRIRSGKRLSECMDGRQYADTVKQLENRFFGNEKDSCGKMVSGELLHDLFKAIEETFIKRSLDQEAQEGYQENYGLYFQLFLDEAIKKKREDDNYIGLSHPYFLSDIRPISEAVAAGTVNKDLLYYIDVLGNEEQCQPARIDLVHPKKGKKEFLRQISEILEVKNAPLGKWPSRYMPALMQQIAINLGTKKGKSDLFHVNGTIFSVNGPPGTGKTTLLKEIVAGNIIERAALLSEYVKPDEAFERHPFLCGEGEGGAYYKYVRYWNSLKDDRINTYGILVASCNNAAVENVTKELPVYSGINSALQGEREDGEELQRMLAEIRRIFDAEKAGDQEYIEGNYKRDIYFTEYAKGLLNNDDVWGLVAAPLGKKANLSDFYFHVLYPLHRDFYKRNVDIENRLERYRQAREIFRDQLIKVKNMQKELQALCDLTAKRIELYSQMEALKRRNQQQKTEGEAAVRRLKTESDRLRESAADWQGQIQKAQQSRGKLEDELKVQEKRIEIQWKKKQEFLEKEVQTRNSIGLLERFFKKSSYAAKNQLADEYHAQAEKEEAEYRHLCEVTGQIQKQLEWAEQEYARAFEGKERSEKEIKRNLENIRKITESYREMERYELEIAGQLRRIEKEYMRRTGEFVNASPVDSGIVLDEKLTDALLSEVEKRSVQAQSANPWFTERYNREREKLFYYAMKLNKEFVLSSKRCRDNLITLAQYWGLKPDENNEKIIFAKQDREAFAPALYQTLFLLVPVLSSTFASMGRLLGDIKESGALGTLIVDEAGQAQPQMALGALFRCRKAVIVGDPKQVEPVVPDDLDLLKKTFDDEAIKPYKAKSVSVQSFADKMNGFGTYLDNGTDYPEWVGCPLLVHRRCISPMYDISNEISYNGIMKQQTRKPDRKKEQSFVYDRSQWIDVEGIERGRKDHFVEAQGEKVCQILERAFAKADTPDLFIISPFTSVVRGMKEYIRNYKNSHPAGKLSRCGGEWMNSHIGTVHTFQGKEAAEVVFLLGCDKSRESAGAVRWVNANIVNVAATRAKYRLYVIGDESVWKNSEVVNRAKNIIHTFAIRQIKTILDQDLPSDEKRKALTEASKTLPPVTSFHTEMAEDEKGEKEYSIDTEGFIQALGPGFLAGELSDEQLYHFGFKSEKMLDTFSQHIQDNLRMGIRLYYLLQAVYEANPEMDTSCCSILFCKAMELRMKECFGSSLKRMFPGKRINGKVALEKMDVNKLALGNFCHIIREESVKLAEVLLEKGEKDYSVPWWEHYEKRLKQCTTLRNACCHSGLFTWEDQKALIREIFQGEETPASKGLLFEAEVGKRLNL